MYLKSLKINNFRKFGEEKNTLKFVSSSKKGTISNEEEMKEKISESTTLLVGKNNSGKTTAIVALEFFLREREMSVYDFNMPYLNKMLQTKEPPIINAEITITLDRNILLNTLDSFATLEDLKKKEIKLYLSYETKNKTLFKNNFEKENPKDLNEYIKFLTKELEGYEYILKNKNSEKLNKKLKELIELEIIKANHKIDDNILKNSFNKIFKARLKSNPDIENDFNTEINNINGKLTTKINSIHKDKLNGNNLTDEIVNFRMESNLTKENLLEKSFNFFYDDKGIHIPENQFGLGYTNLMCIVSKLIDYAEIRKNTGEELNKVKLLAIEEPEAFMHPQLQEQFMEKISKVLFNIINETDILEAFQVLISTHSSHILKSKLKIGNTFNNINYLSTDSKNNTKVIKLFDDKIAEEEDITKYLAVKVSLDFADLFFADALIAVEGSAEEILIPPYILKDNLLNNMISVFNIRGTHANSFYTLFELLEIPTLIITDLDLIREKIKKSDSDEEKKRKLENIGNLKTKNTSNPIIKDLLKSQNFENLIKLEETKEHVFKKNKNILISTQIQKINNYYATSLEEALVLTNYNVKELEDMLKEYHPNTFKDLNNEIIKNSYKIQYKYADKKTELANGIKDLILNRQNQIKLPEYILEGIKNLKVIIGG